RFMLLGETCSVQLAESRISALLRCTLLAPTAVFGADVGDRQCQAADNDRDHEHIKTHSNDPSASVSNPMQRISSNYANYYTVAILVSKIARTGGRIASFLPAGAVKRAQGCPRPPRIPIPRGAVEIQEGHALWLFGIELFVRHVLRETLLRSDVNAAADRRVGINIV